MSESTPNNSRTLVILSGEAISVSARLSGWTLGKSVMGMPLGDGRDRLNFGDLFGQREQLYEAPCEGEVAFYLDKVERRAAVDDSGDLIGTADEGHCAVGRLRAVDFE